MRVMVIVKATKDSEAGRLPDQKLFDDMGRFNQQLIDAGVMLDGAGLKASSEGSRITIPAEANAVRTVRRGPATESNDLIAGYWIWKVKGLDEAIEWARKCPHPHPGVATELEIRPLYEEADFAQ